MAANIKKIRRVLAKFDDLDFNHFEICFQMAKNTRKIKSEFVLTDEQLAKELGIGLESVKLFLNAAYNYTLEDFAKIKHVYDKLSLLKKKEEIDKTFVDLKVES